VSFRAGALKHLEAVFGAQPLAAITRTDVEAYVRQRQQIARRPATVNRERAVLSHLFTKARHWGLVEHKPVLGTEHLPEGNERPRPLTPDEEGQVLAVLPRRHHPLVHLALQTGLRLGELRAQRWQDVDLRTASLVVTQPKSGQHEVLPLNQAALTTLAALPREAAVLFPQMPRKFSVLFARYARKAGLADITFHCTRDTYISRLAPHCSVPTLMRLARHRSYETTRRYLAIDGEHLRDAVAMLPPPRAMQS
jgi:integrase